MTLHSSTIPTPTMHLQSTDLTTPPAEPAENSALEAVPQRVREIAMLRGLGYSFREIAGLLHVSPQAVSLMLSRHRRSIKSLRSAMELCSLSARAVNALGRHQIKTRQEALAANVMDLLRNERNCGRKTLEEISHWLGETSNQN